MSAAECALPPRWGPYQSWAWQALLGREPSGQRALLPSPFHLADSKLGPEKPPSCRSRPPALGQALAAPL